MADGSVGQGSDPLEPPQCRPEMVERVNGDIPPALGDFPAGARIANYRIDGLIGRGGMAVVYRATDVRLDRLVALKILNPELASDEAFRERFIRESRAGAGVDHPHVIPVFEAGDANGVLFIAMRYVAGSDVRALIERDGRLSAQRTVEIVSQVASALDAAHAHGTVHRDVKPANILIGLARGGAGAGSAAEHVYLSDFGLSKQSVSAPTLTMTGQFLGTLDYMSPEQIRGRRLDGRTDLYALACAAFEMLTGEPPFRRDANLAVMWAQVSAQPPPVRKWRPELSPAVDQVIGRALAKAPEDRQSTCTEFAAQLRDACSVVPAAAPAPPVTERAYRFGGTEATVNSGGPDPGLVGAQLYRAGSPNYAPAEPRYAVIGPHGSSGPDGAGYTPSQPRRRGRAAPVLVGCLVVVALAAAAGLLLHLRNPPSQQPTPPRHNHTVPVQASSHGSPAPTDPGAVVRAFFSALNSRDYGRAWQLSAASRNLSSYAAFKQGYAQTAHDSVTVTGISGDVVSVDLAAAQTDGTTKYFRGSYTVRNGSIVASSIRQVS
jgi:serine/threonine protein kinase